MTGSIKPRLYWGYRNSRCPEVKGLTHWEPEPYQPLLRLPPHQGPLTLDPQVCDVIEGVYHLLNTTNTQLAADCWLCL